MNDSDVEQKQPDSDMEVEEESEANDHKVRRPGPVHLGTIDSIVDITLFLLKVDKKATKKAAKAAKVSSKQDAKVSHFVPTHTLGRGLTRTNSCMQRPV